MKDKLPNFLIVGAAKSGTSSMHNYLNQHPEIFMPSFNKEGMKVKEPRFFIRDLVQDRLHNGVWSWKEYKALFDQANNQSIIGEATVLYLYHYKHAIENIKKKLGAEIKIIIMLRHPVERAFSAYLHVSRTMKESFSFKEALDIEKDRLLRDKSITPMVMYKDMGMYSEMVKAYLDNFKDVKIIFYEDFKANTLEVVYDTLSFLGVKNLLELDTTIKYNTGGKIWRIRFAKRIFMTDNIIKGLFRLVLPRSIRISFRNFIEYFLKKDSGPISDELRKELNQFFLYDIIKLEKLLEMNLDHWKE